MVERHGERDIDVSDDLLREARTLALYVQHSGSPAGSRQAAEAAINDAYIDALARRMLVKTFTLFRRQANVSQSELARSMSTSQSAISDIEKGAKDPRLSTLQRIARALGLELHVSVVSAWPVYGWRNRSVDYLAVRPTRIEEGHEDAWLATLPRRRDGNTMHELQRSGESTIRPIATKAPQDDPYMTDQDLLAMHVSKLSSSVEK